MNPCIYAVCTKSHQVMKTASIDIGCDPNGASIDEYFDQISTFHSQQLIQALPYEEYWRHFLNETPITQD